MAGNERSPNYPSIELSAAVTNIKALYAQEGRSWVAVAVAGKAWGSKTGAISGALRSRVGALRQYGLIDVERGGGKIKVSGRGLTLAMRPAESPECRSALKDAALAPPLFAALHQEQSEASTDSLVFHLVAERRFSRDGAARAVQTYQATMAFANLDARGYADDDDVAQDEVVDDVDNSKDPGAANGPIVSQYRWPLAGGITAEVTFRGGSVSPKAFASLRRYLELAEQETAEAEETARLTELRAEERLAS